MTLFKQIALIVTTGFLVLLMLTSTENFRRTSSFLEAQMQVSARDVATTLGIAITTTRTGRNLPALETYFNAMFDSGYYSEIRLRATDGSIIHEKTRTLSIDNIPDWFIQLVPLASTTGTAQVRDGWVPLGDIEVTVHPGLAYAELYDNLMASLLWFAGLFLIILIILWTDLHITLRPLGRITEQAQAIHENRFVKQDAMPKTVELKHVVNAMNHMIDKVQAIFREQEEQIGRYQKVVLTDEGSGLPNRKHFLSKLQQQLSEESGFDGIIAVFKLLKLEEIRNQQGYKSADESVQFLSSSIKDVFAECSEFFLARMSDDEFVLMADLPETEMSASVERVLTSYRSETELKSISGEVSAASVNIQSGQALSRVLGDLDMSITQAVSEGQYQYHHARRTNLILPHGKMEWRQWFRDKLSNKGFYLVAQDVMNPTMNTLQKELFVRVNDDNDQLIPAGVFMPMAYALEFDIEIDRAVFELIKLIPDSSDKAVEYALNLSPSFFQRADIVEDFKQLLVHCHQRNFKLSVETTHHATLKYAHMCSQIASEVKALGHRFGVDQLDLNQSLKVLQVIQPHYVKASASMLESFSDATSSAFNALRTMTKTLDIELYAVGIDSQETSQRLIDMGVDGVQGHIFGKPEALS